MQIDCEMPDPGNLKDGEDNGRAGLGGGERGGASHWQS